MNEVSSSRGLLFDLDGVLYVGKEAIPGAIETVQSCASSSPAALSPTPVRFRWLRCSTRSTLWASIIQPEEIISAPQAALSYLE